MAEQILLSNISKSGTYPVEVTVSAPACCGTVSVVVDRDLYKPQMVYELPSIHINIYTIDNGVTTFYDSRALSLDSADISGATSSILTDIPPSCILSVVPDFDDDAFNSHNNTASVFGTDIWETPTEEFPFTIIWDNADVTSSDGTGSGSGSGNGVLEMPTPDESLEGTIVQYIGETDENYTSGFFYKCMADGEGGYKWYDIAVQSATVNATGAISESITANITVGGVPSGTTIAAGTDIESILRQMLVTYIAPGVSLSLTPSTTLYKKGTVAGPITMNANVKRNSKNIQSVIFYVNGTAVNTLSTGVDSGGSYTYKYAAAITANTTFKVSATDGSRTVDATKSISFVNPYYYGASSTNVITSVDGLTELLAVSGSKTLSFDANNEYIVFMYDAAYGNLTSITDVNGFDNTDAFTRSTTTIDGVTYNVYISNTVVTTSNFQYTFK